LKLSVIVPAYNEANQIEKTILRLNRYLSKQPFSYEIIVVDDGSRDGTHSILKKLSETLPILKIIHNEINHGKGYAVKCGVAAAKGELIFFTDADLSTPPREIIKFTGIFNSSKADILIGSRQVKGAQIRAHQPWHRRLMGRVFNVCVKILTPLRFTDTQCGFKGFRSNAARKIFSEAKETGFNFDIELLLLAMKSGFFIEEIPVVWVNYQQSKINPLKDSLAMFAGLFRLSKIYKNR